ncbi:MAG: hypothetical protein WC378_04285 [Opitutaceae bacterium]|jgi:hypothetical protein
MAPIDSEASTPHPVPTHAKLFFERTRDRMPIMVAELMWASAKLNADFIEPPSWVIKAIGKAAPPAVAMQQLVSSLLSGSLPLVEAGKIAGRLEVQSAFLTAPGPEIEKAEIAVPGLAECRERVVHAAGVAFQSIEIGNKAEVAPLSAQQTGELLKGQGLGASEALSELKDEDTLTQEICGILWLFWKEVGTASNRRQLHRWLAETFKVNCSFKLVEKICDGIGYRPAKQGRPMKKPTASRKRVGIKKTVTALQSGHDQSRPSKKHTGQASPHKRRSR